jgi:hypothetical protein
MGQSHGSFELASEARRSAERFDDCEIKVIKETFKDLCHLSGESKRIDKEVNKLPTSPPHESGQVGG